MSARSERPHSETEEARNEHAGTIPPVPHLAAWQLAVKRLMDVGVSLVAMLVFLPLTLLLGIAIKLDSPGPVFFVQPRVGKNGRLFKLYKFRSMFRDADRMKQSLEQMNEAEGPVFKIKRDPRITRVGAFLRKTSLDELPQLLNVLKGQMSLVGPRPERPELIARFREDWRGYMLRQHVKAGMTGLAQVNGLRGATSLRKRLQYDLFYVRHWSLWFDLRILWLTVFRGFVHRNAH